jgi:hypothetical protein
MMTARRAITSVQAGDHQPGMQRGHQAQGQFVDAEGGQADRLQPVQIGRFVEKWNAIEARGQPVAANQHPAANFAVAALIGHRQGAQTGQKDQQQPERCQRQPGFLALGQSAGLGGGG